MTLQNTLSQNALSQNQVIDLAIRAYGNCTKNDLIYFYYQVSKEKFKTNTKQKLIEKILGNYDHAQAFKQSTYYVTNKKEREQEGKVVKTKVVKKSSIKETVVKKSATLPNFQTSTSSTSITSVAPGHSTNFNNFVSSSILNYPPPLERVHEKHVESDKRHESKEKKKKQRELSPEPGAIHVISDDDEYEEVEEYDYCQESKEKKIEKDEVKGEVKSEVKGDGKREQQPPSSSLQSLSRQILRRLNNKCAAKVVTKGTRGKKFHQCGNDPASGDALCTRAGHLQKWLNYDPSLVLF
jgi:hypothetical protein